MNIFNGYLEEKGKKNMSAVNSAFLGGGEGRRHNITGDLFWSF